MYCLVLFLCVRKTGIVTDDTFPPFTSQQQAFIDVFILLPCGQVAGPLPFFEASQRGICFLSLLVS